jgi:hypothetical protein
MGACSCSAGIDFLIIHYYWHDFGISYLLQLDITIPCFIPHTLTVRSSISMTA